MATSMRLGTASADIGGPVLSRHRAPDTLGLKAFRSRLESDSSRSLSTLIEREIIPRLVIAHATDVPAVAVPGDHDKILSGEVESLVPLTLQVEADSLLAHIETILARGVSVDTLMVDLLAPTARLLGEYWDNDQCDFIDVTMGLWRLQEIVHDLAARFPCAYANRSANRRALFAALPGNQHSLGLAIVEDCFRRSGWQTTSMVAARDDELVTLVGAKWFEIVGLTVTCDTQLSGLPDIISAIRSGSRNPRLGVMVGGPSVVSQPHLALQSGADATAADARQAVVRAEILLEMLPSWITSPC